MLVRIIKQFYVGSHLICIGQRIDIDAAIAQIYVARGDAEYATTTKGRPKRRESR
jgi:hypothetical protein